MKKFVSWVLLVFLILSTFCSCGFIESTKENFIRMKNKNTLDIGVICSAENEKHLNEIKTSCRNNGIKDRQVTVYDIAPQGSFLLTLQQTADNGHNLIFVTDEQFEDDVMYFSSKYPDIYFCCSDSKKSEIFSAENFYGYSVNKAHSRYITGVVAGVKLKELIKIGAVELQKPKIGFVAEFPDAESVSAYTAFYMGIKSVYEDIEFMVQYTYQEKEIEAEKKAAGALIGNGCVLVSQLSDLNGAAQECASNNVFYVGTGEEFDCSESEMYLTSSPETSSAVYDNIFETFISGGEKPDFWCGSYAQATETELIINQNAFIDSKYFDEAKQKAAETKDLLNKRKVRVFDTDSWSVGSQKIKTTASEELYDDYYGVEYIDSRGFFMEYELSATPKFAFIIDGITQLNLMRNEEDF